MWFEKLNLETNPFEDNENTRLIGYNDITDEIFYRINSSGILFVEGKKGSGKTALLKTAINKYKGQGKVVYIDCNFTGEPNIEKVVLKKRSAWGKFFGKVPRNMILLMDDIHLLSQKNNERLKYLFDQNYIKSIIFTSTSYNAVSFSDSFRERIHKVVKLKKLTEEDAVEIIDSRIPNNKILPEDLTKEIFKKSDSNVKTFLKKAEDVCKLTVERNSEIATKEIVDEIFSDKEFTGEKQEEVKEDKKEKPKKDKKKKKEEKEQESTSEEPIKIIYDDIAEKYY